MRVTGGELSGRRLRLPKGPRIRPTLDHVRQAIFNLLRERVKGARVLDLFAGTGALGIEALSRGAAHAVFVDRSIFCVQAIRANLEGLSLASRRPAPFTLIRSEALYAVRRLAGEGLLFDLLFLDPPYGGDLAIKSLNAIVGCAIVSPSGLAVVEHDKRDPLPRQIQGKQASLIAQRQERYGDTAVSIYEIFRPGGRLPGHF